jgi:hypothetical protein
MTHTAIFQSLEYSVNIQNVDRSTTPHHKQIQGQAPTHRQLQRKRAQTTKACTITNVGKKY